MSKVGFYLFERKHGRKDSASSRIRGHWLIKKWKEAEELVWAKEYDVVIYQKVYEIDMAKQWTNKIQILDMCDPDWMEYSPIAEMISYMDAVTVSSTELKKFIENITDKPVRFIPDGVLELGERKKHTGKAKSVVWYGYSHNDYVLKGALRTIRELGLDLTVISDAFFDPGMDIQCNWVKWESDKQCDKEIAKHDLSLLPHGQDLRYGFKSKNRTYKSWALGIPVAYTGDDLRRLLDGKEREKESKEKYKLVGDKYLTEHCVEQYKELINEIKK